MIDIIIPPFDLLVLNLFKFGQYNDPKCNHQHQENNSNPDDVPQIAEAENHHYKIKQSEDAHPVPDRPRGSWDYLNSFQDSLGVFDAHTVLCSLQSEFGKVEAVVNLSELNDSGILLNDRLGDRSLSSISSVSSVPGHFRELF